MQYLSIKHDDRGDNDEANDNGTNGNDAQPIASLNDSPEPIQQFLATGTLSLVATFTDGDGDPATASADISNRVIFEDDGPSLNIVDAPNSVDETQTISGTWTLSEGADGVATGADVSVNGGAAQNLSIPNGVLVVGPATDFEVFAVANGTLTVFNNGTWTYQAGSVASDQVFNFTITATDGDGDPASDTQTITVHDVVRPVLQNGFSNTVEEEHLQPNASGTYVITASGNEDTQDASGLDTDENAPDFLNTITNVKSGNLGVTGGDGSYVYNLAAGIEGSQVQKVSRRRAHVRRRRCALSPGGCRIRANSSATSTAMRRAITTWATALSSRSISPGSIVTTSRSTTTSIIRPRRRAARRPKRPSRSTSTASSSSMTKRVRQLSFRARSTSSTTRRK